MNVSVEPLDEMFRRVGLDPDTIIAAVRSGRSAPDELGPIRMSTKGEAGTPTRSAPTPSSPASATWTSTARRPSARRFSKPVRAQVRDTSGFGPRWGRSHEGQDFAGSHGTSIHSTANGTVVFAGAPVGLRQPHQDPPPVRHRDALCAPRPESAWRWGKGIARRSHR